MVSPNEIKKLREQTGVSMSLCKEALEVAQGDQARALEYLRSKGTQSAEKKSSRILGAGTITAYVHSNKNIGSIVQLDCETDFVAKNDEFVALAYDIAMHISATNPQNPEVLLTEPFIKDAEKTIKQLIESATQKFGERVEITRFTRYSNRE